MDKLRHFAGPGLLKPPGLTADEDGMRSTAAFPAQSEAKKFVEHLT